MTKETKKQLKILAKSAGIKCQSGATNSTAIARAVVATYPDLAEFIDGTHFRYGPLARALADKLRTRVPDTSRKAQKAAYLAKKFSREVPTKSSDRAAFYLSQEWRELRYKVLKAYGARCQCCGATPADGVKMHVDHIKPRYYYPELSLVESNLQVLCEPCNLGKRHLDTTDWRDMS